MHTQVRLTLRTSPIFPVEAASLTPENVAGKDRGAIASMPLLVGNRLERVGDHFDVETAPPRPVRPGRRGGQSGNAPAYRRSDAI